MQTWSEFYHTIVSESEKFEDPFFRGVSNNTYKLLPFLFREFDGISVSSQNVKRLEMNLYTFYKNHSAIFHTNNSEMDSWDILFEMRHYALPTRLLDWTSTFSVALYFAIKNVKEGTIPCIWILDPKKMNKLSFNEELILDLSNHETQYDELFITYTTEETKFQNPIAIIPSKIHPRLVAQSSFFTVHGTNLLPLDEIYDENIVKKIDIPSSVIPDAKKFLTLTNMNEYSLFPDLHGLSRKIMSKDGFFERNLRDFKKNNDL